MRNFIAFIFCFGLCVQSASAQSKKINVEPIPSWITTNKVVYNNTLLDAEAEDGYIDVAFEQQTLIENATNYYKKVVKIISEAGIQNASEISISYNPSFEKLFMHNISIIRNGKPSNKLDIKKFKVVQQETELNRSLYNGTLTAVLFLEDIRVGDIIEYSYSIKGFNPIFNGKFSDIYSTSYSVPIYWLYYKIISPNNKKLNIKDIDGTSKAITSSTGSHQIYEWKFNNIKPIRYQDQLPTWYRGYSSIMVSEFNNWQSVNDWAKTLFPKDVAISPALEQKIKSIQSNSLTKQIMVSEALRFVQDDIRYMGIEIGVHSHLPNNPNKVFNQRFGDCKDKSYLLCTMLQKMGIEANPVLINTFSKKEIYKLLPSYQNFNHCVVRVKVDKNVYFLDPTISFQRGYLNYISFPDYQVGLVITDNTTTLTEIPMQESGEVNVEETFTLNDFNGFAKLDVKSTYSGSYGDEMRNNFKNNSMYEMQKNFRDFYNTPFKNIQIKDSLKIEDDEVNGIFIIYESYKINKFGETNKDKKEIYLYPYVINSLLRKPKETERRMPLGISHPLKYKELISIILPDKWDLAPSNYEFECDAFKLNAKYSSNDAKTTAYLSYKYETFKDYVDTDKASSAIEGIEEFTTQMNYQLSFIPTENAATNINKKDTNTGIQIWVRLVLTSALFLGLIVVIYNFRNRKKSNPSNLT